MQIARCGSLQQSNQNKKETKLRMNTIRIMSHAQFETYTREVDIPDFIAIVIFSKDKQTPHINRNEHMIDLLLEQFEDADDSEHGMCYSQAKQIAGFVRKYEQSDVDIIVTCRYGQSRSAGVAAAITAYLEQDEMKIFENPNKMPNMHCYALICQALGIERTEAELRERYLINAKASRGHIC